MRGPLEEERQVLLERDGTSEKVSNQKSAQTLPVSDLTAQDANDLYQSTKSRQRFSYDEFKLVTPFESNSPSSLNESVAQASFESEVN